MDPGNRKAIELQAAANAEIHRIAASYIAGRNFEEAQLAIEALASNQPDVSELRNLRKQFAKEQQLAVQEASQLAAEGKAKREKIGILFTGAERALGRGNLYLPNGNNAVEKIQQILQLDPGNQRAVALQAAVNAEIQRVAVTYITGRDFEEAQLAIEALSSNRPDLSQLQSLRKQLAREQQLTAQEASRLAAENKARQEKEVRQDEPAKREPTAIEKLLVKATSLGGLKTSMQTTTANSERYTLRFCSLKPVTSRPMTDCPE